MFEILAQIFILMLVVAFSFVAIVGNAMRHAQERATPKRRSDDGAAEKLKPRVFALGPFRTQESTKAA